MTTGTETKVEEPIYRLQVDAANEIDTPSEDTRVYTFGGINHIAYTWAAFAKSEPEGVYALELTVVDFPGDDRDGSRMLALAADESVLSLVFAATLKKERAKYRPLPKTEAKGDTPTPAAETAKPVKLGQAPPPAK